MKMYEINEQIAALLELLEPDPETGEVVASESVLEQLQALDMARKDKLENLAKAILDARAEAQKVKAEKLRLQDMQKSLESKEKRLMGLMEWYTAGENTDCGVAKVTYRTTKRLEVTSAGDAAAWLQANGHPDLYTLGEVDLDKRGVTALINGGAAIPGVAIKVGRSCSLK